MTYQMDASGLAQWTVTAEISYDSTDGTDGTFNAYTIPDMFETSNPDNHLQVIEFPVTASSYWFKVSFTNNDSQDNDLLNIGMRRYSPNFLDDIWVVFGASIMRGNVNHELINAMARADYGRDPVIINRAFAGRRVNWVEDNITSILADIPKSRFIFLHIMGNDVSGERPYERMLQADIDDITLSFRNVVDNMVSSNKVPIAGRLTFRRYPNDPNVLEGTYDGGLPQFGSLPYNSNIIDPIIADLTPNFYDTANNRPMIDLYTITHNNPQHYSNDGVHYGASGPGFFTDIFRDMPMKIVYDNVTPPPLTLDSVNTPMEDADFYVSAAETSRTPTDIGIAQTWVTALNDWLLVYTPAEVAAMQARIDAIVPVSITDYYIDIGPTTNTTPSNWNTVTDKDPAGTIALIDALENPSSITIEVTSAFNATDTSTGLAIGDVSLDIMKDSFRVNRNALATATMELAGLDPTKTYTIEFYSSQVTGSNFQTDFTINGSTQTIVSAGNDTDIATFSNIVPDGNNKIVMDISRGAAVNSLYGYLNAIIVHEIG